MLVCPISRCMDHLFIRKIRRMQPLGKVDRSISTSSSSVGTTYGPYADELMRTDYLVEGVIGSLT
jgi:hypothetical protein